MQQASSLPTDAQTFILSSASLSPVCPCTLAEAIQAEPIKSLCLSVFLRVCLSLFSHTNPNFLYCILQAISSGRPFQNAQPELDREISVQE